MNKLLALLILLAPPFDPLPDAGSVAHSVQTDAGVAQKAQPVPDCKRGCLGKCWWDADAGYCQDTRVERLGFLNARPAPEDFPKSTFYGTQGTSKPGEWGTEPLEKRIKEAHEATPTTSSSTCE